MLTTSIKAMRATYTFIMARRLESDRQTPTLRELCFGLMLIGATGFGGWLQARLYHYTVVQKNWLSDEEFSELTVTASLAPGGNSSNLGAEIGRYLLGPVGMICGYLSMLMPGLIAMLVLGSAYRAHHTDPIVRGALAGMESAAVAMIMLAVVKLRPCDLTRCELAVSVVSAIAVMMHVPIAAVVAGAGITVFLLRRGARRA